jgi:hypothetical protein
LLELAGNCFRVLSQTEQSPLLGRRPVPKHASEVIAALLSD